MATFLFLLMQLSSLLGSGWSQQRYLNGALQTVPHHRQEGHLIAVVKGSTLISCALSCLAEPKCVSTNFGISSENEVVCELNYQGLSALALRYSKGFTFSYYSDKHELGVEIKDGCQLITCLHKGQCYFNSSYQQYQCACPIPWSGDRCETKKDYQYNFTTLGATGRRGPTSNKGYEGTSLQGITVQNGLQSWVVPFTALYSILLCGATGGDVSAYNKKKERGARVQGNIHLQQGTQLTVLIGQYGAGGGGGGGSYIVFAANSTPLAVAGGGGAADYFDGDPGQSGSSGSVNGGKQGKGGKVCVTGNLLHSLVGVGAGGGLTGDGHCFDNSVCKGPCTENDGGKSFVSGGVGGASKKQVSRCAGGFGGGGNCGGGGGYSGGGVDVNGKSLDLHAGGGGSFVPDADWSTVTGGCPEGDGFALFEV